MGRVRRAVRNDLDAEIWMGEGFCISVGVLGAWLYEVGCGVLAILNRHDILEAGSKVLVIRPA